MSKKAKDYRIQIKEDGKWRELALEDITLQSEAEVVALLIKFTQETGKEYRGQRRLSSFWVTIT